MNPRIKKIIDTPEHIPIDVMAMSWVVEHYIKERKGVEVKIVFHGNFMGLNGQILELLKAYEYARGWYIQNKQ